MQKLELTWAYKNDPSKKPRLEPRILVEDPTRSHGDPDSPNMLIHGDNLLALKALEQDYSGAIKCIYIDPPYNTGNAFEHYDDGMEHSEWLSLMKPRIEILRRLLADDGSIWISIDDVECFYLKILCDEVFGRNNFIANVIWEKSDSPRMDATFFSVRHDYILVYAKNVGHFSMNKIMDEETPEHYNKVDENGKIYYLKPLRVMGGHESESLRFVMIAPDGSEVLPLKPDGNKWCWRWSRKKVESEPHRIEWVKWRSGWTPYYRIYADYRRARPAETIWTHSEVGSNRTSKNEIRILFWGDIFGTPKPERLIERIFTLASRPWDLVLDSFLGSGTTSAVAHKMGRRWIGIEMGDHAYTHCQVRLDRVVDGTDAGGITESVGWTGGGGYRFYELWPSVLARDERFRLIINPRMDADMLVRALCKIENFHYAPRDGDLIRHGYSTERDAIHITTRLVDQETIDRIATRHLRSDESLLIMARAVSRDLRLPPNIQVKKIPIEILRKCEYARDSYSLPILSETREELAELKKVVGNS